MTTLFTPEYTNSVENKDVEKVMFEDKVKCENSNQPIADTEKMCDIPVHHVGKDMAKSRHPTIPSYKGLSSQSYQPRSVFDEDMMDVSSALREELMDFEKEYKDVQEIVKKDHIKKSISILLENSKSY